MADMKTTLLEQARRLGIDDRIDIVQDIWDTIADEAGPDDLPLTDEQRRELDARLDALEANPVQGLTWEEVLERLKRDR